MHVQTKTMERYKYHVLKYQQVNAEEEQGRTEEDAGKIPRSFATVARPLVHLFHAGGWCGPGM